MIGSSSLAAGDLFDDDYRDCPARTRLRGGQIADLTVARDAEAEAEVNVSWTATDPASWGLGPNAYTTALVVLLDDGTQKQTRTLALGTRKVAFDKVDTGVEVTVQLAIVTDTADGAYLISDILEQDLHQSLTAPRFTTDIQRAVETGLTGRTETIPGGTFYYVGYNENFGNYKRAPGGDTFKTYPSTPRLRIGLAHADAETNTQREDVDFDAYRLRITDAQGDVVPEGDDVATLMSDYRLSNANYVSRLEVGTFTAATRDNTTKFSNVRINDGSAVRASIQDGGPVPTVAGGTWTLSFSPVFAPANRGLAQISVVSTFPANQVFAVPPDEHRDFPIDVLASDETYKFTAWAVNDTGDVISPVAALTVHPVDALITIASGGLADYATAAPAVTALYVTEFTVLK